ncbi:ABC transporter ATP-binding protein [Salinadaptatus halalkaliphilus]|uniref:ABC-type D-xylose/L-arabinose transporter n=1 Tax=Salinadaptatus halalkaliphilus TaxID=2419781 RepID=A0A4V3VL91_9EURY|nr:ABC transporter ATP-binding protein [Salinadaptatus halalkaliphilus]THE64717.1 ABC transporter ATP-binding protein [Salinadaptatus halalkaliphilus]
MTQVKLQNVTKEYGSETAIEDVSLTVESGETLAVVGPSGCGKSTTLRTVAGFESPTGGRVLFDGEDVTDERPEERNVGIVFQDYALFENMSVMENVTFGPRMNGVQKNERVNRAEELLELLDIGELRDRSPSTLSGGQQQRVGFARALAIEPEVLLLDEPMTGLDAKLKRQLRSEIGSLLNEIGVTTVYVTHDQQEAMAMGNRLAVLNDGWVEQIGTPEEIYERPVNRFVADFVGVSNMLPATVTDDVIDVGVAKLKRNGHPANSDGTLVVRPEDFTVGSGAIEATAVDLFYLGDQTQLEAELNNGESVSVRLDRTTDAIKPGDSISLDIDSQAVHLIDQ